jgi:hypothetical protein
MNILITGMTARHTGGNVVKMLTVIEPLKEILTASNHEWFQKIVTVGEDLSAYDKIFLFLFPPEKIGVTRRYGALDAYARYPEKCIICFDDWQYYQIQGALLNCVQSGRFWNWVDKFPNFARKEDVEVIKKGGVEVRKRIERAAVKLALDPKVPICVTKFSWGDLTKSRLSNSGKTYIYDPSRFAIDYVYNNYDLEFPPEKREKIWVLASLFEHDKFLHNHKFTWPVMRLGHKKTQTVVSEDELCKIYQSNWGIISPSYPTSGDGWWRARWIFSYMFENILYASDAELGKISENFGFTASMLEKHNNNKDLEIIAKMQKDILEKQFMSKQEVLNIFKEILK